jgi:SAM-dependent methyltransferase
VITNIHIDNGQAFDWGNTSDDYAVYRDLYPEEFYQKIISLGLCVPGQRVLDLGTGTGVLPRNLYRFGAAFVGADISENQIAAARRLSAEQHMDISYITVAAEDIDFPDQSFDVITACQCFLYFDSAIVVPKMARILKPGGRFAGMFLVWLPDESEIAAKSEELILKYNPGWTGCNFKRMPFPAVNSADELFEVENMIAFDVPVRFTRESWNGRIRACRGIGASLPEDKIREFEHEHIEMLNQVAPPSFEIPHYAAMRILRVNK